MMGNVAEAKPVAALWQDYLFLTEEMAKLLNEQPDMDLFLELLSQRENLQKIIEQHPAKGYGSTPAGQNVLAEIDKKNHFLRLRLHMLMNRIRNREKVNKAYDAMGNGFAGKSMDYRK